MEECHQSSIDSSENRIKNRKKKYKKKDKKKTKQHPKSFDSIEKIEHEHEDRTTIQQVNSIKLYKKLVLSNDSYNSYSYNSKNKNANTLPYIKYHDRSMDRYGGRQIELQK